MTTNGGDDKGGGLDAVSGTRMEFLAQPASVLRRVKALKKLQVEEIDLESNFQVRLNELEREFQPLFQKINQKVSPLPLLSASIITPLPLAQGDRDRRARAEGQRV